MLQELVRLTFDADRRLRTVPWDDYAAPWEVQKAVLDRTQKLGLVASGQVGAADAPAEERISGEQQIL